MKTEFKVKWTSCFLFPSFPRLSSGSRLFSAELGLHVLTIGPPTGPPTGRGGEQTRSTRIHLASVKTHVSIQQWDVCVNLLVPTESFFCQSRVSERLRCNPRLFLFPPVDQDTRASVAGGQRAETLSSCSLQDPSPIFNLSQCFI